MPTCNNDACYLPSQDRQEVPARYWDPFSETNDDNNFELALWLGTAAIPEIPICYEKCAF